MTTTSRQRWAAYGIAALLTAGAMWAVDRPGDDAGVVQPAARRPAGTAAGTDAGSAPNTTAAPAGERGAGSPLDAPQPRLGQPLLDDPFAEVAPTSAAPPPTPAPRAARVRAPDPEGEAAAAAPPLPFVYLGRWSEGGRIALFLQRGERTVSVAGPGRIDAQYGVRSFDDKTVVFVHLPSGTTQTLRLDADPAAAPRAAAPAARPGAAPAAAPTAAAPAAAAPAAPAQPSPPPAASAEEPQDEN